MKQLEVNHIRKIFRQRAVVDDVSLRVAAGEIVGLLGPNGAGKTTTFLMILGIHRPDSGEIRLNGRDITHVPGLQPLPPGHQLPAPGTFGFPGPERRGQHRRPSPR